MARSLGLDVGDKRIGVALSDPAGILASPLTIINVGENGDTAYSAIVELATQYKVEHIVAGLPRSMNGSIGRQAEKVQAFVENLRQKTDIPIEFRDERLSTVSAKRMMQDVRKMGKDKHDAIAAALILQNYLEERLE